MMENELLVIIVCFIISALMVSVYGSHKRKKMMRLLMSDPVLVYSSIEDNICPMCCGVVNEYSENYYVCHSCECEYRIDHERGTGKLLKEGI